MIAVDSCVVIDWLGRDARADAAVACLHAALNRGPVVMCDVTVSEIISGLGYGYEMIEQLEEAGIQYSPTEMRSAVRAGEMQRRYTERRKAAGRPATRERTVPDFLIGAHALLQCQGLITRDDGFYRDYFKGLKIIVPKA